MFSSDGLKRTVASFSSFVDWCGADCSDGELKLAPGDDSSLVSLAQMAIELKKTPSEALSRLMAKEFLRRKGGGAFFSEGDR